ncbi:MAG: carboxypeptidase regulatory-like domain-containing protein [Acidobacteriia bacterium]|nr:carboxypeptidase regulatory-like domain-containing protein [Terriglobia bacterium]
MDTRDERTAGAVSTRLRVALYRAVTSHWRNLFVLAFLWAAVGPLVSGQSQPDGLIGGVVRHASGDPARAATVTLSHLASGTEISLQTNEAGTYEAAGLPSGRYAIRVDSSGHESFVRTGLELGEGQTFRQDAILVSVAAGGERTAPSPLTAAATAQSVREVRPVPARQAVRVKRRTGYLSSTSKRGSSEFHGALYSLVGNDSLNARGFFGAKARHRQSNFGAFVGGPFVKNKTFFNYHYDRLAVRSGEQSGYGNSTPTHPFRVGDFGRLVTPRVIAMDALGRPVRQGQIFDPASTALARNAPVRDPFPNNRIPSAHPLRSRVAGGVIPLMVSADRPGTEFNVQGNPLGAQVWRLDAPSHHFRVNHSFNGRVRAALLFSRMSHPALRDCGGVDGCRVRSDPVQSPHLNGDYYGTGVYEDTTTHHLRHQIDWVKSAGVLNQTHVVYDEFHVRGHSLAAGAGWQGRLWGPSGNGLVATDAGPPALTFTGNTRYSPLGSEWGRSGFLANHQYGIGHNTTWITGRHTVKIGGDFRHHNYPFRGWANNEAGHFNFSRLHTGGFDETGNNLVATGDPFASFLLGQVNSARFQIPDFPTITENFFSWSIVDEYRLSADLTITIGLRFEYQSAIRERDDNMSTFDPAVPNPGAGGRLGAMIFAGDGPGRTGTRTLESPPRDAFGPRIGIAKRMGQRTIVRGGYGIYYSGVPHGRFDAVNTLGFRFHPTAIDLSNGREAAFHLDAGFPQANVVLPPAIDPAVGNDTSPVAVTRDRATMARIQEWSLTIQRRGSRGVTLDWSYTGNRGSRLIADRRVLGPAANANSPEILTHGPGVLGSRLDAQTAAESGLAMPYSGFTRTAVQSLRPFPHMLNIGYLNVPAGNSFYHAMRARLEKRFTDGAILQASYTWSKLTGMGAGRILAGDGLGLGPQNPTDTQALERGLSAQDIPHRLLAAFTHRVPLFQDKRTGVEARVLGGWAVSGSVNIVSGTPVNVVMANDLEPFLFNGQKRPDIVSNRVRIDHGDSFDAASDSVFDRFAFADPGPLRFGNASRTMNFVRGFSHVAENLSLFKDTWINQKFKLRFETQFANLFNRTVFCDPNRNWSAASFGRAFSQCNQPRRVQFGLRFDF